MASLHKVKQHGRMVYRVSFYDKDGERRFIRLGEIGKKAAESITLHVQQLADLSYAGMSLDAEQTAWLAKIGQDLTDRLAAVGLVPNRASTAKDVQLGEFLDGYIADRTDIKPWTKTNLKQARNNLVAYFGKTRRLAEITAGDADEFRRQLLTRLGENTVRRHCGRAKQFFRHAVRKELIAKNPFADMRGCGVKANRERDYTVTREVAQKVLDACPNAEWRLIFALARFGGLRIPSELMQLRWGDIDWERGRMTVRSPKTEHHEGKSSRVVPLFPELRPHLEAVWDLAEEGAEYVIARRRSPGVNLRTRLEKIIARAGLKPWPKLFHNLRANRQTELAAKFPEHVACEWIGNSRAVAREHYLRVTEADYEHAARLEGGTEGGTEGARRWHNRWPRTCLHGNPTPTKKPLLSKGLCTVIRMHAQ